MGFLALFDDFLFFRLEILLLPTLNVTIAPDFGSSPYDPSVRISLEFLPEAGVRLFGFGLICASCFGNLRNLE